MEVGKGVMVCASVGIGRNAVAKMFLGSGKIPDKR